MMRNETGWFHNNKNLKFEKYKKIRFIPLIILSLYRMEILNTL